MTETEIRDLEMTLPVSFIKELTSLPTESSASFSVCINLGTTPEPSSGELVLYRTPGGAIDLSVKAKPSFGGKIAITIIEKDNPNTNVGKPTETHFTRSKSSNKITNKSLPKAEVSGDSVKEDVKKVFEKTTQHGKIVNDESGQSKSSQKQNSNIPITKNVKNTKTPEKSVTLSEDKTNCLREENASTVRLRPQRTIRKKYTDDFDFEITSIRRRTRKRQKQGHAHSVKTTTKTMQCKLCSKWCKNELAVLNHIKLHHQGDRETQECRMYAEELTQSLQVVCEVCNKKVHVNRLKQHMELLHSTSDTMVKCKICDKTFKREDLLEGHVNRVHSEHPQRFLCHLCPRDFKAKLYLKEHIQDFHVHKQHYQCDVCKKVVKSARVLQRHKTIHTGEKQYACTHCGRRFSVKSNLDRHIQFLHVGVQPVICPICHKKYRRESILKEHIKTIHQGAHRFACKLCSKNLHSKCKFIDHIQKCHSMIIITNTNSGDTQQMLEPSDGTITDSTENTIDNSGTMDYEHNQITLPDLSSVFGFKPNFITLDQYHMLKKKSEGQKRNVVTTPLKILPKPAVNQVPNIPPVSVENTDQDALPHREEINTSSLAVNNDHERRQYSTDFHDSTNPNTENTMAVSQIVISHGEVDPIVQNTMATAVVTNENLIEDSSIVVQDTVDISATYNDTADIQCHLESDAAAQSVSNGKGENVKFVFIPGDN